jgi:hypothetical protein
MKRVSTQLEKAMRNLKFKLIAILASFAALTAAIAADNADVGGTLIYKHQLTVTDTSRDPAATTVGQFFHDFPRGAPGRLPMVPTKEVAILKVRKANGEKIEIQQNWDDSRDLTVGDQVKIEQVDGEPRVFNSNVAAQ